MKLLVLALLCLSGPAFADHDNRSAMDRGTYVLPASLSPSSHTGTAFFSANPKRVDGLLFNNSANTVWIGTATTITLDNIQHPNITNGIPILASSTFKLDGMMTDNLYVTCAVGISACNVRVLEGLNR